MVNKVHKTSEELLDIQDKTIVLTTKTFYELTKLLSEIDLGKYLHKKPDPITY